MASPEASRLEKWFLISVFAAALLYHLGGVTYHLTMGYMSGHEFRQALTAINSYYIDQENNFSLLYETPVLGKPWVSALLEVPIYEWTVVGLSRTTGLPHVVVARVVSITCFYLMLPAIYLLLGRFAVPPVRRLLPLALVLSGPVYLYYSRAFLMDSMALMCCAWFLLGFVRTMDRRRWPWLALTMVAGTGAALIKSATLAVWLLPAAGYGAWLLGRDVRARHWGAAGQTLLWGLATVVVALGSLRWWIAYSDPLKAAHASAWIFTSKNLAQGNWGLFDLRLLFSTGIWHRLLSCWEQAIMSRWLIALGLVTGLALPAARWRVLGTGGLFFLAQFLFPNAYADQDYYFYACAVFLQVALGFTLLALLDSWLPRWALAIAVLLPLAAQVRTYWQGYRLGQMVSHHGGYPFTDVIRDLTPKNSVIVVAGADWAAVTPLYARRRALMVRNGLEYDGAYLERAFTDLAGEEVSALVVMDRVRTNQNFINAVTARFDLERAATFSYTIADVYVARTHARGVQLRIKNSRLYPELTLAAEAAAAIPTAGLMPIPPEAARYTFDNISPRPYQVDFQFGLDWINYGGRVMLSAHPNSDMWLVPAAAATRIEWSYGIFASTYAKADARTDGVEFLVRGEKPDGSSRQIYRRLLDPWQNPGDRPEQHEVIPYTPLPGEVLRFSTRPNQNSAYDGAYTIEIKVQ